MSVQHGSGCVDGARIKQLGDQAVAR